MSVRIHFGSIFHQKCIRYLIRIVQHQVLSRAGAAWLVINCMRGTLQSVLVIIDNAVTREKENSDLVYKS